jgi:hypothetical protein
VTDDVIREVWQAKDAVAARYGYDVKRLAEHLRAEEKASDAVVVDLSAQRLARAESRS